MPVIELPSPPRTRNEIKFFVDESACPRCGSVGLVDTGPAYSLGRYTGKCARCDEAREFTFPPMDPPVNAPPFHLGPLGVPTRLLDAAQLRAVADRDLARVDPEPTAHPTLDSFRFARARLEHARTALNELAKLSPDDAALAAEVVRVAALHAAYTAAEAVVDAKPGAHPTPTELDDRYNAHRHWLRRGRVGDGQLVLRNERLSNVSKTTLTFTSAIIEDSSFTNVNLASGEFHDAVLRRSRFQACDLSSSMFKRATLERCDFPDCRFSLADLIEVTAAGGDWQRIVAGRSTWSGRFVELDLRDAGLRDSKFESADFQRCDLRNVDLRRRDPYLDALGIARGSHFIDCDLRGLKVEGWRLADVVFERCRMHGLEGRPVLEGDVQVIDADLSPDGDAGPDAVGSARLLTSWRGDRVG